MIQIWLDTIEIDAIADAAKTGLLAGVTTNPSILSKSNNIPHTLEKLLELQNGPVAIQVTTNAPQEMIQEGKRLHKQSSRYIVKVPVNREGLIAIHALSQENIPVMGTTIVHPLQALLASHAGAQFLAPYFSHMENQAQEYLQDIQNFKNAKVLAASVKTSDQLLFCAKIGIYAVTIKADLYRELMKPNPKVEGFCQKFLEDWKAFSHLV